MKIKCLFLKVCRRWPHNLLWVLEHGGARGDVLLLPDGGHGPTGAEVSLVEKVSELHAFINVKIVFLF